MKPKKERNRIRSTIIAVVVLIIMIIVGFVLIAKAWDGNVFIKIMVGLGVASFIVLLVYFTGKWVTVMKEAKKNE